MAEKKAFSWVPLPRYPHFVHPTYRNWFRTTVNPLVWYLVEEQRLGVAYPSRTQLIEYARTDKGLYIDVWRWVRDPLEFQDAALEQQVRCRPDVLLDFRVVQQLFALLTSGYEDDRKQAERIWKALSQRHAGRPPTVATTEYYVESHWKGSSTNRAGRAQLEKNLDAQRFIWERRVNEPDASDSALIEEVKPQLGLSANHVRNHLRSLSEYRELLASHDDLRVVGRRIYGESGSEAAALALASLKGALEFLGGR